jgi:hypothetical protein
MKLMALTKGRRGIALLGSALILGASSLAAVALADQLAIDGDVSTAGSNNPLSVSAQPGATVNTTAGLSINYSGSKHLVPGSSVGFTVNSVQTTLPVGYSVASTNLAVPSDWNDNTDSSGTAQSAISFTAPSVPGSYTYAVKWTTTQSCASTPCLNDPALSINLTVEQPVVQNQVPVVDTAAGDADGTEGDTLSASGKFTDPDGDSLTLTADNGSVGTFTDNTDGTWSWSLPTNDDVLPGGTINVTADDGNGGTVTDSFHYSAVNANPTIDSLTVAGTDCDPSVSFTVNDLGTADTESGTVDWGDSSTDDTFGSALAGTAFGPISHHYGSAGTRTVTVNAADDDGGNATAATTSVTVHNVPSNILQPINYTGPRSAFKLGGTIPVKIQVTDCNGNFVSTLTPSVKLQKVDVNNDPDGTDIEPVSTANPTSGTTMRYDSTGQQYIYNLATKGLALANYMVFVSDPSFASPVTAVITLKK